MKSKYLLYPFIFILLCGCGLFVEQSSKYEVVYNGEVNQVMPENEKQELKNESQYTIAFVPKIEGIPYFNAVKEGALEAGKDLGVNILYKGPSSASSEQQAQIIEEFINNNVDSIAVAANDPLKLKNVLQKARDRGIKVVTWDSDTNPEFRSFFVNMVNPEILGRNILDTLALEINEKGNM
ncbi:substrate-binding domain-containing protein [Bacillus sp. N9]